MKKARAVAARAFLTATGFRSVPDGHAGYVGTLQRLADRLGLIAIEPGKAGAVELVIAFRNDGLGEGIGLAEQPARPVAGGLDALLRFVLALQRADLNDPSAVHRRWL